MSNPDQLENDVNQTRESLSGNIDRFNDTVSPSKAVNRRMDRMKSSAGSIKERVMGYADNSDGSRSDAVHSAVSAVQDKADAAAGKIGDGAGSTPQALRNQAQGNPLAAGVIAFGLGWLASALIPASDAAQRVAAKVEQNAGGVVDPLKKSAQEVAGNLQQPLQDSADQLKKTAGDAGTRTADHASAKKDELSAKKDELQQQNPLSS